MSCGTHKWTLKFPQVNGSEPFEVRPVEMTLKQKRREYDFARVKLPWEVGDEMKPHTRYEGGALRPRQPAVLAHDGDSIQTMMWDPDAVDYGDQYVHIELKDLQRSLENGVVDKQWDQVKLQDAYRYAFDQRQNKDLLTEIKFTIPEDMETTLVGSAAFDDTDSTDDFAHSAAASSERRNQIAHIEQSDTYQMVDGHYAVDFNKVSPAKAIWKLNKKYRLTSWADSQGRLWVGTPETTSSLHVAAFDDERVWKWKDVSISHPRAPVQNVVVEGRWVDEPGIGTLDDVVSWINPADEDGFGDFRATGVASRADVDYGLSFTVKNTKAKADVLGTVARLALREEMKKQNSGTVEIDPDASGDFTAVKGVSLGDFLHIVPRDEHFENPTLESGRVGHTPQEIKSEACGGFTHNEIYVITGIEHNLDSRGSWSVSLDVGMYPDVPIEAFVRYFDPQSGEYMNEEQVYDGNWIEDDSKF